MIKDANKYSILEIFRIDSKEVYQIPPYQREYSWTRKRWEALFDDIDGNEVGYFLGSIICIKDEETSNAPENKNLKVLDAVDGQQRLITLSLLFVALYTFLKEHMEKLDDSKEKEEVQEKINDIKRRLFLKKDNKFRVHPQIQNDNLVDYKAILSDAGVTEYSYTSDNMKNRKIFLALKYFEKRIKTKFDNEKGKLNGILSFLNKVNNSCLVKIVVKSHADACILFESLNDRGMPLTPVDLIKNKILKKLGEVEPSSAHTKTHFELWQRLLEDIGKDDFGVQERFFRHYYNAFQSSLNVGVPLATRTNLTAIYEKLMGEDGQYAKKGLNDILEKGKFYSLITRPSENEKDEWEPLEKPLLDLDRIQGTPSHLLILYLLANEKNLNISVGNLCEIVELLVSFFVRRNLTDKPPTRDLNRLFMDTIEEISKISGDEIVKTIRKNLQDKLDDADDEAFRKELEGKIYSENLGVTRFILYKLAEQDADKEKWNNFWERKKKSLVWTIEHIFPQADDISEDWVRMVVGKEKSEPITAEDKKEAKKIQEDHLHLLGNLTISGYNKELGKKSFEEKRERTKTNKDGEKSFIGYKNGLPLNKMLKKEEIWNAEKIVKRRDFLVAEVLDIFKMD